MMYPFLTLDDQTEIVHSEMREDGTVKVYLEKPDAAEAVAALKEKGILVRSFGKKLRITVGSTEENELLVSALRQII